MLLPENLAEHPPTTQKCTFGCPIIDAHFGGGIPVNSVTEVVAESGCGKTQLSLQLLLSAQLPISRGGLSASSIYIHSEFPFPLRRFHSLSLSFIAARSHLFPPGHDPCDYVLVQAAHSADQLFDILSKVEALVEKSGNQFPIRLIVIDSIAALFRLDYENNSSDLKLRTYLFFKISGRLKMLAKRFQMAVMITNQVVDLVDPDGVNGLKVGNVRFLYSSGRRVCAALGMTWANCVNTRLFMSRTEEVSSGGVDESGEEIVCCKTRRRLHVVFAPHLPDSSCEFMITRDGVFGVVGEQ
uniref:RecA family profile 1 domain-containing protein n=1 Tax=Kalanchoe fedtschenkoi TaxID=63787 RepID=A0A7N0ZU75_KALFE